jgi:hypothetical protein
VGFLGHVMLYCANTSREYNASSLSTLTVEYAAYTLSLRVETVHYFEMLVNFYQTASCHVPGNIIHYAVILKMLFI